MQPGDLVRITRASIGVPKNTIGLIVKARDTQVDEHDRRDFPVWHVQLLNGRLRRYLTQDLRKLK
jgi:hypothetical protein